MNCVEDFFEECGTPAPLIRVAMGLSTEEEFADLLARVLRGPRRQPPPGHPLASAPLAPEIDLVDRRGATLCHYAAIAGRVDWLEGCRAVGGFAWAPDAAALPFAYYMAVGGHVAALDWLAKTRGAAAIGCQSANGVTAAMVAAEYGRVDALKCIRHVVGPFHVSDVSRLGWNLLHAACAGGSVESLMLVEGDLGHSAIHTVDNAGDSPLFIASARGHVAILEYLCGRIGNECLVWRQAVSGRSLLHAAAEHGQLAVFNFVMRQVGWRLVNVVDGNDGATAAHVAARMGNVEILQLIVAEPSGGVAALCARDHCGRCPAHLAAEGSQLETLKFIAGQGGIETLAAPDETGNTTVLLAACEGHTDMLRYIVDLLGPDCLQQSAANGNNAAVMAASCGHISTLEAIVDCAAGAAGAEVLQMAEGARWSVAHAAAAHGHVAVLKLLVAASGLQALYARTSSNVTVADAAAMFGKADVLEWLSKRASRGGGGCAQMLRFMWTQPGSLSAAAKLGALDVLKLAFRQAGKAPFLMHDGLGASLAHCAAERGHVHVIDFIATSCGIEALRVNPQQVSVAHTAAMRGHLGVLKRLAVAFGGASQMLGPCDGDPDRGTSLARAAAARGSVDVLRWVAAEAPGCFSDAHVVECATTYGHVPVLELVESYRPGFILERMRPPDGWHQRSHVVLSDAAAAAGHVAVLEFLDELAGKALAVQTSAMVVSRGHGDGRMHVLRYLGSRREA